MNVWVFFFIHARDGEVKGKVSMHVQFLCHPVLQDFDEHISILNAELKINQILYQINAQNDQIALVAKFSKNLLWHARSELPIFRHQLIVIGINAHDLVENDFVNMKIRQVTLTFKVNMIIYKINLSSCSEKL